MEGEILLKIVLLIPNSNQKPNLIDSNVTKCKMKMILGPKIKANRKIMMEKKFKANKKIIMGWRKQKSLRTSWTFGAYKSTIIFI